VGQKARLEYTLPDVYQARNCKVEGGQSMLLSMTIRRFNARKKLPYVQLFNW